MSGPPPGAPPPFWHPGIPRGPIPYGGPPTNTVNSEGNRTGKGIVTPEPVYQNVQVLYRGKCAGGPNNNETISSSYLTCTVPPSGLGSWPGRYDFEPDMVEGKAQCEVSIDAQNRPYRQIFHGSWNWTPNSVPYGCQFITNCKAPGNEGTICKHALTEVLEAIKASETSPSASQGPHQDIKEIQQKGVKITIITGPRSATSSVEEAKEIPIPLSYPPIISKFCSLDE